MWIQRSATGATLSRPACNAHIFSIYLVAVRILRADAVFFVALFSVLFDVFDNLFGDIVLG